MLVFVIVLIKLVWVFLVLFKWFLGILIFLILVFKLFVYLKYFILIKLMIVLNLFFVLIGNWIGVVLVCKWLCNVFIEYLKLVFNLFILFINMICGIL